MKRKDWKSIWDLLKETYRRDKLRIISMITVAFSEIFDIYIDIFLLGVIVDCLYKKYKLVTIISYIVCILCVKYIFIVIKKESVKYYDTKLDYTKDIETDLFNQKAMGLDYELLENTLVSNMRYGSFSKSYYGITGWCLFNIRCLLQGTFSIGFTFIFTGTIMLADFSDVSIIRGRGYAFILLMVVSILSLIDYKAGIHYTQKAKDEINKAENQYNRKQYYMDKFFDIEFQKDTRMSKLQGVISQDVAQMYDKLRAIEYKHGYYFIKREHIGGMLVGVNCVLVYLFVGWCAIIGVMTAGSAIIFASSILQFSSQMINLASAFGNMKSVSLFAQEYFSFMSIQNPSEKQTMEKNYNIDKVYEIEFKNVSFKYPDETDYSLKNINLKLFTNRKIAIVGENGSGKTTLVKLLCGFYSSYEGEILINGENIKNINRRDYWKHLSIVFQDFNLLCFSIRDNFDELESDENINRAINEAGLEIKDLDEVIDKSIYLHGKNYSGGEKQKIAIARAILKHADLIVMDEPTAALDPIAENEIFMGLDNLINDKGGIFISHRLSSCKFCHQIIVMRKGCIVQIGNHRELLSKKGDYKKLWDAQSECYQ